MYEAIITHNRASSAARKLILGLFSFKLGKEVFIGVSKGINIFQVLDYRDRP